MKQWERYFQCQLRELVSICLLSGFRFNIIGAVIWQKKKKKDKFKCWPWVTWLECDKNVTKQNYYDNLCYFWLKSMRSDENLTYFLLIFYRVYLDLKSFSKLILIFTSWEKRNFFQKRTSVTWKLLN